MGIQNIDIKNVTTADLYKYNVSDLVYIYLTCFQTPRVYKIENLEHQTLLHADFLDFIKGTKYYLGIDQFVRECKWWWPLIPDYSECIKKINLPNFSYYSKPITNTIPYKNINLLQLCEAIKNPAYFEKQTNELRSIADKTQRANFKQTQFDFVLFSGIFPPYKRNSKSCEKPSGYLCVDIDHIHVEINELKNKLSSDCDLDAQL